MPPADKSRVKRSRKNDKDQEVSSDDEEKRIGQEQMQFQAYLLMKQIRDFPSNNHWAKPRIK